MIEPERRALSDELLEQLLASADAEARAALFDSYALRSTDGVAALLDAVAQLVISDPNRGRQLATVAAEAAEAAGVAAAVPRARYLKAQACAGNADFPEALRLIEITRAEFEALGEPLEALRTNIGLMQVLREQGCYQRALEIGAEIMVALEHTSVDPASHLRLRAMVQESWGSIYDEMGRYDEALAAYAAAEEGYSALQLNERIGSVSNNRGVVLLGLGRAREALGAFEEAAAFFAVAGLNQPQATAVLNIGNAHRLLGAYNHALTCFEEARRRFERLGAHADLPSVLLDTAEVYLAINLYPEAISTFEEADRLLRQAGMPHDRARGLWGIGVARVAQGRLDEAERALSEAAALFYEADNLPLLSGVMLEQAGLQTLRSAHEAALATSRTALALATTRESPIQQVYAHLRTADLVLPDLDSAERHLREAGAQAEELGLPHLRYRAVQRLGHVRRLQGRSAEALAHLEHAIAAIEGLRGTSPFEAVRASFLHDKTAAYEDLVHIHLEATDEGAPQRAFAAAERAKSRSLVDLLAGGYTALPLDGSDPALNARREGLQADLNAIYLELLGDGPDAGHRAHLPELRARAAELEHELSLVQLRLESTLVGHTATGRPATSPGSDGAIPILAYHILGDEIIAFIWVGESLRVARRLGSVGTVQRLLQRLGDQWDRFRNGPAFVAQHMALLTETVRRVLHGLYHELIAPLEALLPASGDQAGPAQLAIVPHGLLHQVPFHALFDGQRYLIDRFELSYAPSATVLAHCAARQPREQGKALLVGVADPSLPAVSAELEAVRRSLPEARIVRDADATRAVVGRLAAGCTTLHMACHGLFRADNPLYSALQLGDGRLTAGEVLGLDLDGALVVLSACESGRSQILGGDEVIGLARSFLGAGAATLVVSLWLVQDEAAARLMGEWYRRLAQGQRRAAALRAAQLALREHYPHPYYWAPFLLIGHP